LSGLETSCFLNLRFFKKDLDNLFEERKEAARANIAKSEFLANVSHGLMTPIHGILSFSRFGIDKIGDVPIEKLHEYLLEINKCGHKLMGLLEDLLHLSKLEAGDITCQFVKSKSKKLSIQSFRI
jgi:signal transduction histidine kinase